MEKKTDCETSRVMVLGLQHQQQQQRNVVGDGKMSMMNAMYNELAFKKKNSRIDWRKIGKYRFFFYRNKI